MKEKLNDLQSELRESAHKIWLAGLGALTVAGEEGQKMFNNLVEKGQEFEDRDHASVEAVKKTTGEAREKVGDLWSKFEESLNDKIGLALQKLGVPTKEEIGQLTERVDKLMEAINKLNETKEAKAETK
ncbi:MAG: phasin family protein [Acidobacteriota bacterium]|nr:phasin family protein [Acidobacteriota bacterium]